MDTVVKIIGIVIVVMGVVLLLKPAAARAIMGFFRQGKRIYLAALARLTLAVVFLLAASACRVTWAIGLFGVLFIASGLLIFALGAERIGGMLDWYMQRPAWVIRLMAVLVFAFGGVIVYCA
jgi:hypothetical protein